MAVVQSDPVRFAVLARRFDGIVKRMQHTLVRASRSGVIVNGHDCSCCLLTEQCELLSIAQTIPIHVMSGADEQARSMKMFHPILKRGDAYLHNSPYHGATHAADLTLLVPIVDHQGTHRFTAMAKSHQADIGNSQPTTYMAGARDVYEEGALIFPAVKVQRDFETIDDVVRMGQMRIRAPKQWHGDLLALIGAARTGEKQVMSLARDYGWDTLAQFAREWLEYSQAQMQATIANFPAGSAYGESRHDAMPGTPSDGVPVKVKVDVDPSRQRIGVDLTDNIDCMPNGLNLSEATARSSALIGVFNSFGARVPANGGSIRCVDVKLRQGCAIGIPNSTTSCSVATTNLSDRVVNAVQQAMSGISAKAGMAEAGAIEGPAGAVISGFDQRDGRGPYINQLALAGTAGGAAFGEDGWLTLGNACTAGMWTMDSIEVDELKYPLMVFERRLLRDSEGPGRFCGTPGCCVVYGPVSGEMRLSYACDGFVNAARGVQNGGSGAGARQWLLRAGTQREELPPLGDITLKPGDLVTAITTGGGGYGRPNARNIERVAQDVREGYVSCERARDVYTVVIDKTGGVDLQATRELRREPKFQPN